MVKNLPALLPKYWAQEFEPFTAQISGVPEAVPCRFTIKVPHVGRTTLSLQYPGSIGMHVELPGPVDLVAAYRTARVLTLLKDPLTPERIHDAYRAAMRKSAAERWKKPLLPIQKEIRKLHGKQTYDNIFMLVIPASIVEAVVGLEYTLYPPLRDPLREEILLGLAPWDQRLKKFGLQSLDEKKAELEFQAEVLNQNQELLSDYLASVRISRWKDSWRIPYVHAALFALAERRLQHSMPAPIFVALAGVVGRVTSGTLGDLSGPSQILNRGVRMRLLLQAAGAKDDPESILATSAQWLVGKKIPNAALLQGTKPAGFFAVRTKSSLNKEEAPAVLENMLPVAFGQSTMSLAA